jgi:hypothetical protein
MTVGGIKPRQEVQVTVKVLQVLEVENGAYQLRIPQSYFVKYDSGSIGTSPQTPYSLNISIENLQNIAYLSIPKNSFLKQSSDLKPTSSRQILIEKPEASTADLTKDIFIYFRLKKMD